MNDSKKDFKFDKRASSYDAGFEGRFSRRFYNLLLSQIEVERGACLLDVGCGTGALLKEMSGRFGICGFGIDVEENMLAEARRKCPDMDIRMSKCESTPFEDAFFDAVTACMAYHHFADKDGFAKEAARILKPGGCLYIADPRFPFPVRKTLNAALALFRVAGEFFTPEEIYRDFSAYGFEPAGHVADGYAQVVRLKLVKTNP